MSMKEDIEETKKKRFRFLSACYEESGADPYKVLRTYTIAGDRAFDHNLTDKIVRYLEEEGLVEVSGRGDKICITHKGIRAVEQAAGALPDEASRQPRHRLGFQLPRDEHGGGKV